MIFDIKDFFSEDSILVTRYELTDVLVHKIQLFYERFSNYKKVGEDVDVVIPCVLLFLQINGYKKDLKCEVVFGIFFIFNSFKGLEKMFF